MQAAPSLGHPMEKLLDNYMMAERGGGAEEGGAGATFMVEDGGMISYTGVFMDDDEDLDDDASASSTEAEVMAHLHAALGGSVSSTKASGSNSSSSSSGSTSTSGGTVSAAPEGDKGEGWKMALLEGLEDFLKVEGAVPAGAAGSGGSRRFSFDLSNLDMQTLEQLAAGATSGLSSRRGSFSLTMLEAEGLMAKGSLPVGTAAPFPSSGPRGNGNGSGLPLGNMRVKQEMPVDTASRSNSVSFLGTSASNSTSASSTDISDPVSNRSMSAATTTSKNKAVKKETSITTSASQATSNSQPKKGGSSPTGAVTGGTSLRTTSSGLISAASLLPTPQTPHKAILTPSMPTTTSTTSSSNGCTNATMVNSPNGNGGTLVLPIIPKDGIARIGIYTLEERKVRVARFQAKRGRRVWRKKIKYDCRKKLADNRPRVKGRFVRRDEEIDIIVGGAVAAAEAAAADGVADGGSSALLTQLMDLDELLED